MPSTTLTIDEVYGGGGNTGSTYKNDYIVIHNETNAAIDIDGYSIQYASSTGAFSTGNLTTLTGSIAAGGYYLIQESMGAGGTASLPTADATGGVALSGTAGRVALVDNSTALSSTAVNAPGVLDYVAYGAAATPAEGGSPALGASNTQSIVRNGDGNTDTDNNAADFAAVVVDATHVPLNGASMVSHVAQAGDSTPPTLASTTPAENAMNVAVGAGVVLTFDEAIQAGTGHITLSDGGAHPDIVIDVTDASQVTVSGQTVTITPTGGLQAADTYRVALDGGVVRDTAGNAVAADADALDFTTAAAATTIPTGNQTASFTISTAGTYDLAANGTFTETGAHVAIAATVAGAAQTVIDIDGALIGANQQRAIVATVANGQVDVGAAASITAHDADGLQYKAPSGGGHVNLLNLGSVVSQTANASPTIGAAGVQHGYALNYNAAIAGAGVTDHISGGLVVNGSTSDTAALLQSDSSDAVRLGSNQTLTNFGRIIGDAPVNDASSNNNLSNPAGSTAQTYDSSRGVEINGGSHDTVDNFGRIEGAQHGVDAGDAADTDIAVTNEVGGVIIGHNGSGVSSDGATANAASLTNEVVVNSGQIFGEYAPQFDRSGAATLDGDGDGVDIDGAATVTNNTGATIAGAGANEVLTGPGAGGFDSNGRANHSEGLSLGGGMVENHGLISGADYGVTVNNDSTANRSGVADTTIVNESDGLIIGQNGYAIRLENKGADGLDTDSITNHGTITGGGAVPDPAGTATIEGGGADQNTVGTLDGLSYTAGQAGDARFVSGDGAAIQTGEGNDILVNDGAITGANGHAISLEGGDDTLTLYAEGSVTGGIEGGAGADTLNLTAHASTTAQTLTGVADIETLHVQSGQWTVADSETYADGVTIDGGALLQIGQGGAIGAISGAIVDNGGLTIDRSDAFTIDASVSGTGELNQQGSGVTTLTTAHTFAAVIDSGAGVLDVAVAGGAGAGPIALGGTATLHVEAAARTNGDFADIITGFAAGETLDVGGVGANATATLGQGNVLTVTGDAGAATLHLDPSQNFSANVFNAAADGTDGADITLAAAPNAPMTIFSDSFDDFTAKGFAPGAAAATGELDSNVWRVVGLSDDTNPAFGFTGASGGDFGRGLINGSDDPFTAGVYSPSANHALVLQPTNAELNMGGFVEAHIVNTSGIAANPATLDFDWTFRNSGGKSDDLQLSYSTDDMNFTPVTSANFSTPGAADASVASTFSTQHEHVVLDGLNVPQGGDLFLRWTNLDVTGSGNSDEVGIDNVLLQAAPSAPVSGAAFSIAAMDANKAEGADGATTPFTFTVTRAGDTTAAGDVDFAVAGSGSNPADAADFSGGTLPSGTLHFLAGETSQTLTINVAGDAVTEPTETFGVSLLNPSAGAVVTGAAATGTIQNDDDAPITIGALQGAGQTSPFVNQTVMTEGVVTAIDTTGSRGFWIQSEAGHEDNNSATSDAVFVFTNATPTVQVGHLVDVTGVVNEFAGSGSGTANNLTTTELDPTTVTDLGAGHMVAATVIGDGGIEPPNVQIASDGFTTYDPTKYAADFYESLEGMQVTVHNAQAVDSTFSGETYIVPDDGEHGALNARGGVTISDPSGDPTHANFEPERIELFEDSGVLPGFTPAYNMGDQLGDVTGVISYFNGNYELLPTTAPATVNSAGPADDVTALHSAADQLTVGAYNVDNLGPTGINPNDTATRYAALGHDIAVNLGGPVILGVEEIQDADGEGSGSNLSGATTLTDLANAVSAAGGPGYSFTEVAPATANSTGGAPGGNIRSTFLYDATKVQLVAGSTRLLPDPTNVFVGQRDPLAADFIFNGQKVTVIDVHELSRLGGDELFGKDQPPLVAGDDRRTAMADVVYNYVIGLEATDPNANIVVEGDFNGFPFETAQTDLTRNNAAGAPALTNLVNTLPVAERYSYNFEGDSEQLDNLFVSPHLLASGTDLFDDVHVNTGKLASAVTDPNGQASDHDPVLSQLTIGAAPVTTPPGGGGTPPGGGTTQMGGTTPGQLQGSSGGDSLTGGSAGDTLLGGDGADTLTTGSGHDQLFGQMGDDHIVVGMASQGATVFAGQGNDVVDASASTHANYISGDLGDDAITAGQAGDTVLGGSGADTLVAGAGHDQLYGNAGNDHVMVGAASQGVSVYGGQGDDVIDASRSNAPNYISGDIGNDTILSGAGFETVLGGQGDDSLVGGAGAGPGSLQLLFGNQGNDHLSYAGAGGVELFGGQDSDTISLTATQAGQLRYAFGNLGSDTLTAAGGADSLYGGQGDDVVSAANDTAGRNYLSGDLGNDVVTASAGGSDTLHGGAGADTLVLTAHAAGNGDSVAVGAGDSTAASATDESNLQHIFGFTSGSDHVVLAGHAALAVGAGGNLATFVGGTNASEADAFSAAYAYAYGDGGANAAHVGATEYLAVQESYGATTTTYLFTADHHVLALVGTAASGLQTGDVLAA